MQYWGGRVYNAASLQYLGTQITTWEHQLVTARSRSLLRKGKNRHLHATPYRRVVIQLDDIASEHLNLVGQIRPVFTQRKRIASFI